MRAYHSAAEDSADSKLAPLESTHISSAVRNSTRTEPSGGYVHHLYNGAGCSVSGKCAALSEAPGKAIGHWPELRPQDGFSGSFLFGSASVQRAIWQHQQQFKGKCADSSSKFLITRLGEKYGESVSVHNRAWLNAGCRNRIRLRHRCTGRYLSPLLDYLLSLCFGLLSLLVCFSCRSGQHLLMCTICNS